MKFWWLTISLLITIRAHLMCCSCDAENCRTGDTAGTSACTAAGGITAAVGGAVCAFTFGIGCIVSAVAASVTAACKLGGSLGADACLECPGNFFECDYLAK